MLKMLTNILKYSDTQKLVLSNGTPCIQAHNLIEIRIVIEILNSNLKTSSVYYYFCDDIQFRTELLILPF